MQYKIEIDKKAVKFISKQPKNQQERIFKAIYKLPFQGYIKALQGFSGYYRLRVGEYRIIYTVNNSILLVQVVAAGNRGQIYK